MKKLFFFAIALSFTGLCSSQAPCSAIAEFCEQNLSANFISDGQSYRAFLSVEDVAEFKATLYGGNTYRIAACSGTENGNLMFNVLDRERKPMFDSSEHENASYWDFEVENTFDCIIEAQLNIEKIDSGCAVLLIAFEN
ncbi:MAG: hypothetical protein AAF487_08675 [Bacteroidota bacterium]